VGCPLEEFPENGWDKVMDTNVKGVFFLTQRLLPLLENGVTAEDPARVINIGSVDGLTAPTWDTSPTRRPRRRCTTSPASSPPT
jgi:NAD(P)-dependent dehydrogenase (short-subunit alcohol dehydrogenase family)